jgi:energy-coupling factor transporter ATP-binding protein EcfA2
MKELYPLRSLNILFITMTLITFIFPIPLIAMFSDNPEDEENYYSSANSLPHSTSMPSVDLQVNAEGNVYRALSRYYLTNQLRKELIFHRFTKGQVIYAYGSSTSGKSTFTDLFSRLLPRHYTLVSTRKLKAEYLENIIREICPDEYEHVRSIDIDIILLFLFKDEALPKECPSNIIEKLEGIKAKHSLIKRRFNPIEQLHYVYTYAFALSQKGQNVIIDNLDVLGFLNYISLYNIYCPLHMLLLYCPPDKLLERVESRNERARLEDKGNLRAFMRPLQTFIDIYKCSTDENFIDEIEKNSFLRVVSAVHGKSRETNDQNPLSQLSLEELLEKVNLHFGFSPTIKLQSKYPYDMLLDTSRQTPEELFLKVYEKLVPSCF